MADPNDKLDLSPAVIQRAGEALRAPKLDGIGPRQDAVSVSPLTKAFSNLSAPPEKYNLVGTSPVTYKATIDNNSKQGLDGNRGIEITEKGASDVRFMAGSYTPSNAAPGTERYTAGVAWTPINTGGLKVGPMLGDVAQINSGSTGKPFERLGVSVGLYATMEDKTGSGVFAKIETDPSANNKPRVHVGVKAGF